MMALNLLQAKTAQEREDSFCVATTNQGAVAFIDPNLKDYRNLIAALKPGTQVLLIDSNRDGVAQITQILQIADILGNASEIASLHIIFTHYYLRFIHKWLLI
jgi:16S rRNA G1207 methylase RsmC